LTVTARRILPYSARRTVFGTGSNCGDNSSFVVNFGLSGDVPQAGDL
jgi:hypothetical protein